MHGKTSAEQLLRRPIKVLILMGSWVGGGAERVAVHLMDGLNPEKVDTRLGLLRASPYYLDHLDMSRVRIDPEGDRHFAYEGPNRQLFTPTKIVSGAMRGPIAFRRMIEAEQPDVVLSFLKGTAILTWLALRGMKNPPAWIAREGNHVLAVADNESPNNLVKSMSMALTRKAYQHADLVLANASDMAAELIEVLKIDPSRMRMINNPIAIDAIRSQLDAPLPAAAPDRPFILTAGRLEYQKAHEVMIDGFARSGLARSHALVILGRGSREEELKQVARNLGVAEHVHFIGFEPNPYMWMNKAEMFVLSSRWEGFPSVAAEALAAGAPLLLTDFKYGACDMIEPGVSGEMVPMDDPAALGEAMASLIADPQRRARLAAAGLERVERFEKTKMIARYEDLFEEAVLRKVMARS